MVKAKDLVGAWKLVEYYTHDENGENRSYPYGESPIGTIAYSENGYMSAQLMSPGRKNFANSDILKASDAEWGPACRTYIGYGGRYSFDEEKQQATHHVETSSYPNFVGTHQQRNVSVEGNKLIIHPVGNQNSRGLPLLATVIWERR
jgi:hypothetical protein